ncbi:hypothetical protein [Haematobacter massiliensis]|uniref:hypothetical protein n=1 Tax=Haematobacter massiliensis TaxID=195105 RepID=UPI00103BB988|nr:hypothetical protein [Haematobacter massiliensis]QBJ24646.1 hypothetical protein HmaOT1_10540 [Haematobacter massiliensis]
MTHERLSPYARRRSCLGLGRVIARCPAAEGGAASCNPGDGTDFSVPMPGLKRLAGRLYLRVRAWLDVRAGGNAWRRP